MKKLMITLIFAIAASFICVSSWAQTSMLSVDKAMADFYIQNYKDWSKDRVNTIARGFNLNKATCDAVNKLMTEQNLEGVRVYYGLTQAVSGSEWPKDELVKTLVYPVDNKGNEMQMQTSTVYMSDVADGFTRPCPEWCD